MLKNIVFISLGFFYLSSLCAQEVNSPILYGDMMVTQDQLEEQDNKLSSPHEDETSHLEESSSLEPEAPALAVKLKVKLWTDGVLPIRFSSSISESEKEMFMRACNDWSRAAKIKCQIGSYLGKSLRVTKTYVGCWSTWGMNQGAFLFRRQINLDQGCWRHGTILHEIGHTLGLIHEHQRPDRDQFIQVLYENIDGKFLNFNKKINFNLQKSVLKSPYDFLSIMHYDRMAFSKNGSNTLFPKAPYEKYADIMGTIGILSENDRKSIAELYK